MSLFTSMWRVWLGIALVVIFGVPVLSVLSWMVGGPLGFIVLGVIGVFILVYLFSNGEN
jgi:hypothetical protein